MKKSTKITLAATATIMGCCTLLLSGCGGGSDITNSSSEIVYNGGIVSVLDNDLIFINGYNSNEVTSMDEYNSTAEKAYMASVKKSALENDEFTSPEGVKKVKDRAIGISNLYSFVYGNDVYYAAPSQYKNSSNQHDFKRITLYKCGFDGSGEKEILNHTNQFNSSTGFFRALKFNGSAYLFVFDGTELSCISLENSKRTIISSKATSVAIPREGEKWNGKVYYTENKDNAYGQAGNEAFMFDVATTKSEALNNSQNYTVTFTGRVGDEVFYTMKYESTKVEKTLKANAAEFENTSFSTAGKDFYRAAISNVYAVGNNGMEGYQGYIFSSSLSGSAQIMYVNITYPNAPEVLLSNGDYSNILFTHGDLVYYSTSSGISSKSVAGGDAKVIVEDSTIVSGKVGYDFYESGNVKNIYYFAERKYAEDDETEEAERDKNVYLYMKSASGEGQPKLVGQTVK